MGRGKALSVAEQAKIDVLQNEGFSNRKIAEKIGRHKNVVNNYVKDKENYGKNMKRFIKTATTPRERRAILKEASNSPLSVSKIKAKAGVSASQVTVYRVIKSAPHLKLKRLQKKPPLDRKRKEQRLEFARLHQTWDDEWKKVIFSDEKKFNLDGPDGFQHYFHDLRKSELFLNRNHSRQGGVMVWGGVTSNGVLALNFQTARMNAQSYLNILETALPEAKEVLEDETFIFQHDNAPIHTARVVKCYLEDKNVSVLNWPPYSPDLNIMENLWGWLSRQIYSGGKQYDNVPELINAIKNAWNEVPASLLSSLFSSMKRRIFEVISKNGGSTNY